MQKTLVAFCLLLSTVGIAGQSSFLRHYSINEGLPSSENYEVFQDSKGYIWVASDMGVSRFDGYNFTVYTKAEGLTDNVVFSFSEDAKGRIWFLTFNGKLCYFRNDSIYGKDMELNNDMQALLGHALLTSVFVDTTDTLWLGANNGLYKAAPVVKHGQTTWAKAEMVSPKQSYLVKGGYVTTETSTSENVVVTRHDDFYTETIQVPNPLNQLLLVRKHVSGSLLLFFTSSMVCIRPDGTIMHAPNIKLGIAAISENDSMVWIGQKRSGMYLYSLNDFEHPVRSILQPLSLTNVLKDHEKGYWFTTLEDGLFYMPSADFTYYPPVDDSLLYSETTMRSIDSNRTWIVARFGIFESYRGSKFKEILKDIRQQLPNYGSLFWWNAMPHTDGTVWLSGSGGVAIVDLHKGTLNRYIDFFKAHPNTEYSSRMLLEDGNKNVWSLNLSTLTKINYTTKNIVKLIPLPSRALRMEIDQHGHILIATANGIFSYYGDSLHNLGAVNPAYKARFTSLKSTPQCLIAGSKDAGLYVFTTDTVYNLTKADGLSTNNCRYLSMDENGTVWMATPMGINAVTIQLNPFKAGVKYYNTAHGLLTNDIDQVIHAGSLVWARSKKGITSFNPDLAIDNRVPPPVYITSFTLNNQAQPMQGLTELDFGTGRIGFNFRSLTFKNAGKQLYRYKLEGVDTGWTITQNNSIQFARLPAGSYRLIVAGINNSGVASTQPATYRFTILAPFYQKWWFTALMFALALVIVIIISVITVRRIRKREELKTQINQKLANYQLQALRAQMNPHFIFNCLNAIQDFILMNEPEQAQHYLSSFSKLIRKTLDNSGRTNISLKEEVDFLHLYLDLERMRFVNRFNYKIAIPEGLSESDIEVPSMMLQPFVENAIRHGKIGGLDRTGELKIDFSIKNNELVCVIDDNGVGINQSLKMKTQLPGVHELHAMHIMNDRIRTLAEVYNDNIRYTLKDKSELAPGLTGTQAEIHIPLKTL